MSSRCIALFVIAVFSGLLWLPMIGGFIGFQGAPESGEKRILATWPSLRLLTDEGPAAFRDQIEASVNDQFGFRTLLIRTYNRLMMKLLGTSGTSGVTVGSDGWLFLTSSVENYFYQYPFKKTDFEAFLRVLEERQRWLAARGSAFVFMVVPNKIYIYPEHLSAARWAQSRLGPRNMDRILDHLRQKGTLRVVDLRERFAAAKKQRRLYHRIDSHWNDFGAFLAYQELMVAIGETPLRDNEVRIREVSQQYGGLANMLNMVGVFDEQVERVIPKQRMPIESIEKNFAAHGVPKNRQTFVNKDAPERTALVFGDSFFRGSSVKRYLARHFRTTIVIRVDQPGDFDRALIEEVRPALVIQEHVERYLSHPRRWRTLSVAKRLNGTDKPEDSRNRDLMS